MRFLLLALTLCAGCSAKQHTGCYRKPLTQAERIARLEEKIERLEALENQVKKDSEWSFDAYLDHENRIRKFEHRKRVGVEETEGYK